jgi:hypothetical protein
MKSKYEPPYLIILTSISLINIIFSTYFISIFLAGVVFKIFLNSLKKEHYYIFSYSIFTFLVIETTQGVTLFLLTLISLFIYFFVIPRVKHIFSSSIMAEFIFIFFFYISIFVFVQFNNIFNLDIFLIFILNFILDSFIVGFIL